MTLTTGATLQGGRYTIQSTLHTSDTEVTYRATHQLLDQPVLMKTLRVEAFAPEEQARVQANFAIGASRFAQCVHPHLARVIDCFYEAETPYLVWETIAGDSLRSRLETHDPVSPQTALQELRALAGAVQQLHDHHLVHGAITADAVFYRPQSNQVVLTNVDLISLMGALPPAAATDPVSIAADLRGLATLFYSRLIGDLADSTLLATAQCLPLLQTRLPHLPAGVEAAILLPFSPDNGAPQRVDTWLAQIETALAAAIAPPVLAEGIAPAVAPLPAISQPELLQLSIFSPEAPPAQPTIAPPAQPAAMRRSPRWFRFLRPYPWIPITLGITAIASACGGSYLGLALRLQDAEQLEATPILGSEIFGRDQNFPPTDNWPSPSRRQRAATEEVLFEPLTPAPYTPSPLPTRRESAVTTVEQAPPANQPVTDPADLLTDLESEGDNFSVWESQPLLPVETDGERSLPPIGADTQPGEPNAAPPKTPPATPDTPSPDLANPTLGDRPSQPPSPTHLTSPPSTPDVLSPGDAFILPPAVAPATPLPDFESVPQDVSLGNAGASEML